MFSIGMAAVPVEKKCLWQGVCLGGMALARSGSVLRIHALILIANPEAPPDCKDHDAASIYYLSSLARGQEVIWRRLSWRPELD